VLAYGADAGRGPLSNPLYITSNIVQSEYSNQNINSTLLRLPVYNISAFQL